MLVVSLETVKIVEELPGLSGEDGLDMAIQTERG
jgi:hypothetical protein